MSRGMPNFPSLIVSLALPLLSACILPGNATAAPAGATEDLRAAYATPQDVTDGKGVAQASCASCHGVNGIATAKGVPNIASQRAVYMHRELLLYKAGGRGNTPMNNVVKFLSDDALLKVAAYYASLDPAQPARSAKSTVPSAKSDPVSAGKAAAAACAGCHGEAGISKTPGMPSLSGLDPKYLVAAMTAYKSGARKNDIMKGLVAALNEADMNNIALFFATQKPGKAQTPASGNQVTGKTAAAACAGCHGESGAGSATAPGLAGQETQYFAAAIRGYKDGSRSNPIMKGIAESTAETAVKDIAAYYATLQPQAPNVRIPLTTAAIVQRCDRCHGVDGNSTDLRAPALASQRIEYLQTVLRAYQKGERKSTAMSAMLDGLTEADLDGLADHYGRKKARSVVYVPVPAK